MGTTNVANWDVSYIDANGAYNGDVTGDLTGDVTGNVTGNLTGDVTGDVTGDLTGDVVGNVYGQVSTYTTNGAAVSLSDRASILSGVNNLVYVTLSDGLGDGQIARFNCANVDNNCRVTPAKTANFTSITFDAVNEYAELVWSDNNDAWLIISTNATVA